MSGFVLDNSVCIRWCFDTPVNAYANTVIAYLADGNTAFVPVLWLYEVASVLAKSRTKRLLTDLDASRFFERLDGLEIRVDHDSPEYALTRVFEIAVQHSLTGYDAAYLELRDAQESTARHPRRLN